MELIDKKTNLVTKKNRLIKKKCILVPEKAVSILVKFHLQHLFQAEESVIKIGCKRTSSACGKIDFASDLLFI